MKFLNVFNRLKYNHVCSEVYKVHSEIIDTPLPGVLDTRRDKKNSADRKVKRED